MLDVRTMLPHHKKESKLDGAAPLSTVVEIATLKSCDAVLFFEVRKRRDLFLWLAATPGGPSVKFHVVNVHTMDEMRLTGNCLKGSRPILSFDAAFDAPNGGAPHLRLIRELLGQAFGTPAGHPKAAPFHDHVMHFGWSDNKLWFRHYQIVDKAVDAQEAKAAAAAAGEEGGEGVSLVEIGPRFVLDVVRVFAGAMGGPPLWVNPAYVSPNAVRHEAKLIKGSAYASRVAEGVKAAERATTLVLPVDPTDHVFDTDALGEVEAAGEVEEPPRATKKVKRVKA